MSKSIDGIDGSCLCGEITFRLKGTAEVFHQCHCSRCRKTTGSAHAANIFTRPENIEWLSGVQAVKRFDLPEARMFSKQFCTHCGSSVPFVSRSGKVLVIPAGTLTAPITFSPDDNLFWGSKAEWYEAGLGAERCDRYPQ